MFDRHRCEFSCLIVIVVNFPRNDFLPNNCFVVNVVNVYSFPPAGLQKDVTHAPTAGEQNRSISEKKINLVGIEGREKLNNDNNNKQCEVRCVFFFRGFLLASLVFSAGIYVARVHVEFEKFKQTDILADVIKMTNYGQGKQWISNTVQCRNCFENLPSSFRPDLLDL